MRIGKWKGKHVSFVKFQNQPDVKIFAKMVVPAVKILMVHYSVIAQVVFKGTDVSNWMWKILLQF